MIGPTIVFVIIGVLMLLGVLGNVFQAFGTGRGEDGIVAALSVIIYIAYMWAVYSVVTL